MTGQKKFKRFGDKVPYIIMAMVAIMGLAVIVASFVTLPGCASNMGYLETVTAWNDMVESYDFQYQLADPETQAKWKAEIDPKIIEANQALEAWGAAVDAETARYWPSIRRTNTDGLLLRRLA